MVECALCGFSSEVEIVNHVNEAHEGGLKAYLNIFPDLPVVNQNLYTAIENAVFFGYIDDTEGLNKISAEDRELLIVSQRNNAALRSEVSVEPDF